MRQNRKLFQLFIFLQFLFFFCIFTVREWFLKIVALIFNSAGHAIGTDHIEISISTESDSKQNFLKWDGKNVFILAGK